MRIVVDLDGTICSLKQGSQSYADVRPLEGAVHSLQQLKAEGHEIIIHTARSMRTSEGNIGKVNRLVGKITLDWLERFEVPYDEIVFGKPFGDVYIDDLGYSFKCWSEVLASLSKGE